MTIYQYGWIAWIWRLLALGGVIAAGLLIFIAGRIDAWVFGMAALPLAVPALFFPLVVAARIDKLSDVEIEVTNLWFMTRTVRVEELGTPKVRLTAQGAISHIDAPRAWVPVTGGLPIYVDLYASIPDRAVFDATLRMPKRR